MVMSNSIISGARVLSYEDFHVNVLRAARGFHDLGIVEGDTIGIMLRNDPPFFEASFAAGLLGAYSVPINWHYNVEETRYILEDSDAKVLLIHADLLYRVRAAISDNVRILVVNTPPEIQNAYQLEEIQCSVPSASLEWDSWLETFSPWNTAAKIAPATMIYTSGTTGRPKGVRRQLPTPDLVEKTQYIRRKTWGITPQATVLVTGPVYHTAPNYYSMTAARDGAEMILQPRFDAEEMLRMIEQFRVTNVHLVPTMFVRLLRLPREIRERYDISSLEHVVHGAAPCSPEIKRAMMEWWGLIIYEYYGSTESGVPVLCAPEEWLTHPGTVGRVCEWAKLKIFGEQGEPLTAGQIGDIYTMVDYQSDFTYHKNDEKRREIEREGMITSGDRGYLNDEGFLFLSDRKNDMVISGGVNIYPAEIEKELILLSGVKDCAVFGIPDEEFGESLMAYVELEIGSELPAETVKQFLKNRIAGYKVPRIVEFHQNLPREDSGKIFKRKLRHPYWKDSGRKI